MVSFNLTPTGGADKSEKDTHYNVIVIGGGPGGASAAIYTARSKHRTLVIDKGLTLEDLKKHLFTLPEHPDWIPYRTSYYQETWGFCLSHNDLLKMLLLMS